MNQLPQATAFEMPAMRVPTLAEQKAAKRERDRRLFAQRTPVEREESKTVVRLITAPTPAPGARVWREQHDSHVAAFYHWKGNEPLAFLKQRCRELRVAYADMIGPSRDHKHIAPRHRLMAEVKTRFPDISLPQIGRMFGGRDHTTCLSALRKQGLKLSDGTFVRRSINDVADQVYELLQQGLIHARIAEIVGFSQTGVWSLVKRRGWQEVSTYRRPAISDHADTLKEMFDKRASYEAMSRQIGFAAIGISRFIRKQGWTRAGDR